MKAITVIALFSTLFVFSLVHAQSSSIQDCAVALLPQIDVRHFSLQQKKAWLNIVTEQNYESIKKNRKVDNGGSATVPIEDIIPVDFTAFFDGDFSTFVEKRRNYFAQNGGSESFDQTIDIFRQSLSPEQLNVWLECVRTITTKPPLVTIKLENDNAKNVLATIHSNDISGQMRFKIDIDNGTIEEKNTITFTLQGQGERFFLVNRIKPENLIIIVNSVSGSGGATAVSNWPKPIPIPIIEGKGKLTAEFLDANEWKGDTWSAKNNFVFKLSENVLYKASAENPDHKRLDLQPFIKPFIASELSRTAFARSHDDLIYTYFIQSDNLYRRRHDELRDVIRLVDKNKWDNVVFCIDGGFIYWVNQTSDTIVRAKLP